MINIIVKVEHLPFHTQGTHPTPLKPRAKLDSSVSLFSTAR